MADKANGTGRNQMVTTRFDDELEVLTRRAERDQERIGLLQRLRELELEEKGGQSVTTKAPAPVAATGGTKRRGRPPKVKSAEGEGTTASDAATDSGDSGKGLDLPKLLETIAQQNSKPLLLDDFVTKAEKPGIR